MVPTCYLVYLEQEHNLLSMARPEKRCVASYSQGPHSSLDCALEDFCKCCLLYVVGGLASL